jgi:hypothetical protein
MQEQKTESEQLEMLAAAIRERRALLDGLYARSGRAFIASGLVPVQRLMYYLATRYLDVPKPQAPFTQTHELGWYERYLTALCEIGVGVQAAVRSRQLTPRSPLTRVPIPASEIDGWASRDLRADAMAAKPFDLANVRPGVASGWADARTMPAGWGVNQSDLEAWLGASGVLREGEMQSLIGRLIDGGTPMVQQQSVDTANAAVPETAENADAWHLPLVIEANRYALEEQLKSGNPSKANVAAHLERYAKENSILTTAHRRSPSAGTIARHLLRGWVAPTH